jgi:hypothetical protein
MAKLWLMVDCVSLCCCFIFLLEVMQTLLVTSLYLQARHPDRIQLAKFQVE